MLPVDKGTYEVSHVYSGVVRLFLFHAVSKTHRLQLDLDLVGSTRTFTEKAEGRSM